MIDVFFVEEIEQKLLGQISLFIFQNLNIVQAAFANLVIMANAKQVKAV